MNYSSWGDEIKVTIIGQWGHDAYSRIYTYSGAKGHFPDTIYRFSRCGESSIEKDGYHDIEIKQKDFQVGHSAYSFRVDEIRKADSNKALLEECERYMQHRNVCRFQTNKGICNCGLESFREKLRAANKGKMNE